MQECVSTTAGPQMWAPVLTGGKKEQLLILQEDIQNPLMLQAACGLRDKTYNYVRAMCVDVAGTAL